jgi:hypothetical protein
MLRINYRLTYLIAGLIISLLPCLYLFYKYMVKDHEKNILSN